MFAKFRFPISLLAAVSVLVLTGGEEKKPDVVQVAVTPKAEHSKKRVSPVVKPQPAAAAVTTSPVVSAPINKPTVKPADSATTPADQLAAIVAANKARLGDQGTSVSARSDKPEDRYAFVRVDVDASLPALPKAPLSLDKVPSSEEWGKLTTDEAVSQANGRFAKAKQSVQSGQFLSKQECEETCRNLEGYLSRLNADLGSMDKESAENIQVLIMDACSDLTEAANIGGSNQVSDTMPLLNRAENYLREAENLARKKSQKK